MVAQVTIPTLQHAGCEGCGGCCGPVPCSREEYRAIINYTKVRGIDPKRQGINCPYLMPADSVGRRNCAVYEVRPLLCRLFGPLDRLICRRGHNAPLNAKGQARAQAGLDYEPGILLHTLTYRDDEIQVIIRDHLRGSR